MIRARAVTVLAAIAFVAAFVTGMTGAASAQPAGASPAAVVTLTYDASRAGNWTAAITQGVANWNAAEQTATVRKSPLCLTSVRPSPICRHIPGRAARSGNCS